MIDIEAAVVRTQGSPFRIEALTLEEPGAGEVLVRIAGVGVCHTDASRTLSGGLATVSVPPARTAKAEPP